MAQPNRQCADTRLDRGIDDTDWNRLEGWPTTDLHFLWLCLLAWTLAGTGATAGKGGVFYRADQGTDEVDELYPCRVNRCLGLRPQP
jgi:hypothetical protein